VEVVKGTRLDGAKQFATVAVPWGMKWAAIWICLAVGGMMAGWEIGEWQLEGDAAMTGR
jgi:hypothetical protein